MRKFVPAAIGCMLLMAAPPAAADPISFTGSVTGLSYVLGAGGDKCAPLPFLSGIDPASTVGHSNLGDFTLRTETCIALGGGRSLGTFIIDFGADQFSGSFDGGSTPTDVALISNTDWLFTILAGTGRFADASGMFEGTGTADATTRPTHVVINFAAVPEPATWGLMILGFGGVGVAMRRRRRQALEQIA